MAFLQRDPASPFRLRNADSGLRAAHASSVAASPQSTWEYDGPMISAMVLAAGLSTRMKGEPKALLRIDDRDTFVTRIVRTLNEAGIDDVVVVVGHEGSSVAAAVGRSDLSVRTVVNPSYAAGQFSSLLAGLDAVERPELERDAGARRCAAVLGVDGQSARRRFADTRAPVVRAVRGPSTATRC